MILDEALSLINATLDMHTNKPLTGPEREVLQAAWQEKSYSTIAESLYLSEGYIKDLAYRLWKRLSEVYGEKINKFTFRSFCDRVLFLQPVAVPLDGTVLIVDDLVENLSLLSKLLKQAGYKVRSVTNGPMALKTAQANPPDVILLDIMMPGMDGYQVCEALKKEPKTTHIPIIFLSALDDTFDKVRAFEAGGVDYVSKPFQAEEVLARINSQLTIQSQRRKLQAEIFEHQQTTEVLYQSRSVLVSLINTADLGMAVLQAIRNPTTGEIGDFRCTVANPMMAQLLNRHPRELIGKLVVKHTLQQLDPTLFPAFVKLAETGISFEREVCDRRDEREHWYKITATRLGDGFGITVQDITPYKQPISALRDELS